MEVACIHYSKEQIDLGITTESFLDYLSILYSDHVYCFLIVFDIIFYFVSDKKQPTRGTLAHLDGEGEGQIKACKD